MGKLTDLAVKNARPAVVRGAPPRAKKYGDGGGLWLVVSPTTDKRDADKGDKKRKQRTTKKWVFRFMQAGKAREMGLGPYPEVSLAAARQKALEARRLALNGGDPIAERKKDRGIPTFGEAADAFIEAKAPGWKNAKHDAQWRMTLAEYAKPLRGCPVDQIATVDILAVLKPIWQSKPETASRLRGRLEMVIDAARAHGHIEEGRANPARWRGHLDKLLPKRSPASRSHHAAMPYVEVPGFIARLRERNATAALALEFCILTAARSGEVLGARWQEIDRETKIWTVPASRMKAAREHRVPLTERALEILAEVEKIKTGDFVFPGQIAGKPLSVMALEMVLRRMEAEVTTHGFRSSFRDWAGNETSFPRELAEHSLAHVIGDKAEQAYRRGDALERRRELMAAWGRFCEPKAAGNVTPIRALSA